MNSYREQLVTWRNEIGAGKYGSVLNQYKYWISKNQWSLADEVQVASFCVISLNVEAHKMSKPNSAETESALVIFELTKLFCESFAKSWDLVTIDFPASVFYIFKYLLDRDYTNESLFIAAQAFAYQKKYPITPNSKNQPNVLYSMLIHLFVVAEKVQLSKENFSKIEALFMFLSTNAIFGSKRSKLPGILKYFSSFLLKCARCSLNDYVNHCSNVLNNLALAACQEYDVAESTFMEIIRTLVYDICELSLNKQSKKLMLDCLNTFEESCETSQTCISFCRNIYRIAVCLPDDKCDNCLSDIVVRANYELKSLISNKSPILKSAAYFSTVIIIKMRDWDSGKCPFKKNCATQLFDLLYTLAELTYETNLNELFLIESVPRRDIRASAYLCCFLLSFAESIADLNITVPDVYTFILKSAKLCRECILNGKQLEKNKRQQMNYFIGVVCVNIYRRFSNYEKHEKYIELCTIICPAFMELDAEDIVADNLPMCLEKLIAKMCSSYRATGSYVEALIASVAWSLVLPNCASTFMEIFGKSKQILYTSNGQPEYSLHLLNCTDLLKHEKNTWHHERLNKIDSIGVLRAELEQYKKFNICSVKLLHSIIEVIRNSNPSVYQKALLYMMIGEILTNSDSAECLDFLKKFMKSIDVLVSHLNKFAISPLENEITTLHALLGDLLYVKFRIELLIHRSENECELQSLSSFKKPAPAEPGMEPSFREESNITLTNYVCLSAQRKLTRLLDLAVKNWQKGLKNKSVLDLSHLRDVALIYRLYCDTIKEIEVWKLLYSAAKFVQDPAMAVYAYSNLLVMPWNEDVEWKENFEKELLPHAPENIILFHRLNYLSRRLVDGFDKSDEKTLMSITKEELAKHNLWATYYFLMSRCLQLNLVKSAQSPRLMSFLAYSCLMYRIRNKKWNSLGECCELQSQLFDVVVFLVSSNVRIYQVLEAKSYLKESINLILKLSLPLRTCHFLNISIRIDTLTCALDECYLKLQDVCDILELKRDKQALLCKPSQPAPVLSPIMDSDLRSDGGGRPVMFPEQQHIAPQWKFQLPEFLHHDLNCECDLCTSHEYSRLLCEVTTFFGVYYRLASKGTDAREFFEGVIRMHDVFSERFSPVYRPLLAPLLEIKTFAMFEYANCWAMVGDLDAAASFNKMALACATDNGFVLRHDCTEQRWAILSARSMKAEKEASKYCAVEKTATATAAASSTHRGRLPRPSALLKPTSRTLQLKTPARLKTVAATPSRLPKLPAECLPQVWVDAEDDDHDPHHPHHDHDHDHDDYDDVAAPNAKAVAATFPAEITPFPRRSRRVLVFDEFASPNTKMAKMAAPKTRLRAGKRNVTAAATQMSTPPDIVMQTPSAIEKRTKKLGERKNLFVAAEPNVPVPEAAPQFLKPATRTKKTLTNQKQQQQQQKPPKVDGEKSPFTVRKTRTGRQKEAENIPPMQ